jgi:Flp pilus assembly protein TadB
MSKERARKRAEERARRRAPKSRDDERQVTRESTAQRPKSAERRGRQLSKREQRQRKRMWAIAIVWLVANGLIWLFTDTWNARWLGLTVTTILVPVVVWLLWDPEGRVDL